MRVPFPLESCARRALLPSVCIADVCGPHREEPGHGCSALRAGHGVDVRGHAAPAFHVQQPVAQVRGREGLVGRGGKGRGGRGRGGRGGEGRGGQGGEGRVGRAGWGGQGRAGQGRGGRGWRSGAGRAGEGGLAHVKSAVQTGWRGNWAPEGDGKRAQGGTRRQGLVALAVSGPAHEGKGLKYC